MQHLHVTPELSKVLRAIAYMDKTSESMTRKDTEVRFAR